ncbi:gamma-glutamylcyclotransferase [Alkalihalobacillus sp. 1P02AB]|uniref:gamma-glutamylcyclotransferase family protein n=1 Tax=Alkalihalobacillus sp. 1P02AB TaxID=3132260 RepID=UPI0039A68B03
MEEKHLLFVYGTLRKGGTNDFYLKNAKCLENNVSVQGELYDSGLGYPILYLESNRITYGDLYEINEQQLFEIDRLEDYQQGRLNNEYERVETLLLNTEYYVNISVLVYIAGKSFQKQKLPLISSGDWLLYIKRDIIK